jgi:hypothetical protein
MVRKESSPKILVRFFRRTWSGFVAEQIGSTSHGFINSILLSIPLLQLCAAHTPQAPLATEIDSASLRSFPRQL